MFGEKVKIRDGAGNSFVIEIDTCNFVRLAFELKRNGNNRLWRPSGLFGGGDWETLEQGYITPSKGDVWYSRAKGDFKEGIETSDANHLDIYLHKSGDKASEYYGITLFSFITLNGPNSSGGSGYIDQPFALQAKGGQISWDIPGRYKSQ